MRRICERKKRQGLDRLRINSTVRHEVSGHEFIRADKTNKMCWALAPVGLLFAIQTSDEEFFRYLWRPAILVAAPAAGPAAKAEFLCAAFQRP
jgi:hypothetical protein